MFWNIIYEAYCGNFSFAILITNILQLIVTTIACIIGYKVYKINKQDKHDSNIWEDK